MLVTRPSISFFSMFPIASSASLLLTNILLLLFSTAVVDVVVHRNNYVTGIVRGAEGLRFSMPNFLDASNITIVIEEGWYTNEGYEGAFVNSSSGVVVLNELTSTSLMGRMVYHSPVNLLHPITNTTISFSTRFTFQIVTSNLTQCGSGIVFAATTFRESPVDSSGDTLGLVNGTTFNDTLPLFALEFDTFDNSDDNFTTDNSESHVAIDVGNLFSARVVDTSDIPALYLYNNYTWSCWMDYNSSTHLIRVWMSNSTSPQRPADPLLEFFYDLSLVTTESMYIGFTGNNYGCGSGDQSSAIFSWDFDSDLDADLLLPAEAPAPQEISSDSDKTGGLTAREIGLVVVISVLALAIIIIAATYVVAQRKRKDKQEGVVEMQRPVEAMASVTSGSSEGPQIFRYTDVLLATGTFAKENKIGEGSSSNVYKGVMPGGAVVAVKRLKEGLRKQDEFFAEMVLINKVKHPNLMQLKGWCYHESGEALLIYDYMSNGGLDSYLFGNRRAITGRVPPEEEDEGRVRMRILNGVAAALDYLHWGMDGCILHRDVKAANVFLTEEMEAKLGDFGLARLVAQNVSVAMTSAMGTMGYVAPEVITMGKITDKADVFSFGVLMLEMACGRRAITFMPSGGGEKEEMVSVHVVTWIGEMWETGMELAECLDRRIPAEDWEAWERVVKLGMACCNQAPADRPNMQEVHGILQHIYNSFYLPRHEYHYPS